MWYDEAAKLSGHMAAEAPANAGVFSWAVVPASDEPIMQAGGSTCQVLETAAPLEAPKGGFEGPTTIETALPKPQQQSPQRGQPAPDRVRNHRQPHVPLIPEHCDGDRKQRPPANLRRDQLGGISIDALPRAVTTLAPGSPLALHNNLGVRPKEVPSIGAAHTAKAEVFSTLGPLHPCRNCLLYNERKIRVAMLPCVAETDFEAGYHASGFLRMPRPAAPTRRTIHLLPSAGTIHMALVLQLTKEAKVRAFCIGRTCKTCSCYIAAHPAG